MDKLVILRRRKLGMSSAKGIAEKSATGIRWTRNDFKADRQPREDEVCIRWGCTSNVASKRVLNTAAAIHQVADKASFRMLLDEHELCPPTKLIGNGWEFNAKDLGLEYPIVMRTRTHSRGRGMAVAHNPDEARRIARQIGPNGYMSNLINKLHEYRVAVVQGRVAWVAEKTPGNPDDVAWNVAKGGRFDNVRWGEWPLKAVRVAVEAFELSELDFGGVDVMTDADGNAYVIEINSAPSLTSDYRQACFAKCFDYIAEHGKARIPRVQQRGDWKKFIHPALSERALTV